MNLIAATREAIAHVPFFQTTGGAITLALITALSGGVVAWFFTWRRDQKEKNRKLDKIIDVLDPENKAGLVQTVDTLEVNVNELSRELENHQAVSQEVQKNIYKSIEDLKGYIREMESRQNERIRESGSRRNSSGSWNSEHRDRS